jgi:hypothetical protein
MCVGCRVSGVGWTKPVTHFARVGCRGGEFGYSPVSRRRSPVRVSSLPERSILGRPIDCWDVPPPSYDESVDAPCQPIWSRLEDAKEKLDFADA